MLKKSNNKILYTLLIIWFCLMLMVLAVFAKDLASETDVKICESKLSYSWRGYTSSPFGADKISADGASANVSVVDEKINSDTNGKIVGGSVSLELKAVSTKKNCDSTAAATTIQATITNISSDPMRLTNVKNLDFVTEGSILAPNDFITVEIKATPDNQDDETNHTTTKTISFEFEYLDNSLLTFISSEYTSYSVQISNGDNFVIDQNGASQSNEYPVGTTFTPSITVPNGYTLYGWRLSTGKLFSAGESIQLEADTTVYPVLMTDSQLAEEKVFQVGTTAASDGSNQYWFYEDAVCAAMNSSEKVIILLRNYTLPTTTQKAGVSRDGGKYTTGANNNLTYIVPQNITFAIPYSETTYGNSTTCELNQIIGQENVNTTAICFRKLTLEQNTTILCRGKILVDSIQLAGSSGDTGRVAGPYGQIDLKENTEINLESNSILYCYGYISGEGTVKSHANSKIYELFQIRDWRGGRVVSLNYNAMENHSFLISQFYMQNIESHLIICQGSDLIGKVCIYVTTPSTVATSEANFIGNNGLFVLKNSGYIHRYFDTNEGIIKYELYGNAYISDIFMSLKGLMSADVPLHTSDYVLNIPSSMSITVKSGAVIDIPYQIKLLPDTVFEIEEGATVNLTSGTNSDNKTVYGQLILYDYDDWTEGPEEYSWGSDFIEVMHTSTGQKKTRLSGKSAQLIVDGTLNVSENTGIYSTNNVAVENGNNALSGSGTIVWNNAPISPRTEIKELISDVTGSIDVTVNGTTTNKPPVAVTPLQAPLAGIATSNTDYTNSMAYNSTYKGLADNYWYQYVIKAVAKDEAGEPVAAKVTGVSAPTLENVDVSSEQTVGYIANSTAAKGVFKFKVETPQDYELVNVKVGETVLEPENGIYSLTGVTQDTTIQLNFEKTVIYSVKITWDQPETAIYTVTEETYTWNPLELLYNSETKGSWNNTKSVMSITLDNTESTGGFNATFTYDSKIEANTTWTGLTDNKLSVAAGQKGNATFTATPTEKPAKPENGSLTLGTITITLNKE